VMEYRYSAYELETNFEEMSFCPWADTLYGIRSERLLFNFI
jgi:hypothetical protein